MNRWSWQGLNPLINCNIIREAAGDYLSPTPPTHMLPMWGHKKYWLERHSAATSKTLAGIPPAARAVFLPVADTWGPPRGYCFCCCYVNHSLFSCPKDTPTRGHKSPTLCFQPEQLWRTVPAPELLVVSWDLGFRRITGQLLLLPHPTSPTPLGLNPESPPQEKLPLANLSESRVPATRPTAPPWHTLAKKLSLHLINSLEILGDRGTRQIPPQGYSQQNQDYVILAGQITQCLQCKKTEKREREFINWRRLQIHVWLFLEHRFE